MKCEYEGCDKEAVQQATGNRDFEKSVTVKWYCEEHAYLVADKDSPEYHTTCPNCGCRFGVN